MQTDFEQVIDKLQSKQQWDFPGGVFPAQQKELSNQTQILTLPLAQRFFVPVKQHIGVEGHVIVVAGDKVLKGQALSKSMNDFAVPVHAPTSGTVIGVGPHESAHPSGLPELTVEIEPDGEDKWHELSPLQDYQNQSKMTVLAAICDAGISGMGGAGFPTHIKAAPKKEVEFLIINGVECEPYITSDDRLMREHAWQIRQGIDVLTHLLSPKKILIAIEDNKPEAIEAMQVACHENPQYMVCAIPTKYPAGGEKQLIQVLTNREVPKQGLPGDVGVIMHNVGTCYAIADAVFSGKPLTQRVVTVSGHAVNKPGNVWALVGTPIEHLLTHAEYQGAKQPQPKVIMGGPMMGFTVTSNQVPVVKITNCLLLPTANEVADTDNEQACIRCGMCADACPASLLPQQLFWHSKAKELEKAQEYNLFDCIECGACAYVCPSEIPLVHYYRIAKAEIRIEQDEKQKADKARERFESRSARLVKEQEARDEKHRKAAEARKQAMESNGNGAKDKIAAALARAKAKKRQANESVDNQDPPIGSIAQQPSTTAADPSANTSSNERVAAAIARAKAKRAAQTQAQAKATGDAGSSDEHGTEIESAANESTTQPVDDTPIQASENPVVAGPIKTNEKRANEKLEPVSENALTTGTAKPLPVALAESLSVEPAIAVEAEQKPPITELKVTKPRVTKARVSKVITTEEKVSPASSGESLTDKQIDDASKKVKVTAAVAKAKAKRAALQKAKAEDETVDVPLTENKEEQQLDAKKRRIATAVAKAKAKKAAQTANTNNKDES